MTRRPVVLSLRASGLGDLLTAVPALRAVARAFPEHVHALATPLALAPLALMTGAVDVVVPIRDLRTETPVARGVDVAVDLHGSGPQSHQLLLDCRPESLIAFAHPDVPASRGAPVWRDDEHDVHRWCRLLEGWGIPADVRDLDIEPPGDCAPAGARGVTLLHPGAGAAARRWPAERWSALARAELGEGRPVAISVGLAERTLADEIRDHAPSATIVDTNGDVTVLVRAVAAAARVVCGDTGMAHLATALRTPSVVLCGPTPPSRWGPPADRPWHVPLWAGRSIGDPHAEVPDGALLELQVCDVLLALRRLPVRPARAPDAVFG